MLLFLKCFFNSLLYKHESESSLVVLATGSVERLVHICCLYLWTNKTDIQVRQNEQVKLVDMKKIILLWENAFFRIRHSEVDFLYTILLYLMD